MQVVIHADHLSIETKQLQLSGVPHPHRQATWNLSEQNKNIFCGSNVRQLKRVVRGLLCPTDRLWETLRVLVCCPAHVLEVVLPPTSLTMALRMRCHFFLLLAWTGSSGGLDVTHWHTNQFHNSFSFVFNINVQSWWRNRWIFLEMALKFLK